MSRIRREKILGIFIFSIDKWKKPNIRRIMLVKTKLNSKAHNKYRMKFMKTLEHENVEWNLMNREYNLL